MHFQLSPMRIVLLVLVIGGVPFLGFVLATYLYDETTLPKTVPMGVELEGSIVQTAKVDNNPRSEELRPELAVCQTELASLKDRIAELEEKLQHEPAAEGHDFGGEEIVDFLRAYPNEPATEALNRALNSTNQKEQMLAFGLVLSGAAKAENLSYAKNIGMRTLKNRAVNAHDVAAARFLARYVERDDAYYEELENAYEAMQFPDNFAIAVALAESGEDIYLQDWGAQAIEIIPAEPRKAFRILNMCAFYSHEQTIKVVRGATTLSPIEGMRAKARGILAQFDLRPQNPLVQRSDR